MPIYSALLASGSRLLVRIEKFAKIVLLITFGVSSGQLLAQGISAANRCVQDICGDPKPYFDRSLSGRLAVSAPVDVEQLLQKDITPLIRKMMDSDLAYDRFGLENWDHVDQLFDPKTFDDDQKIQFAMVVLSNFDWDSVADAAYEENGKKKYDPSKMVKLRADLSTADATWFASAMNIITNSKEAQAANELEHLSLETIMKVRGFDPKRLPILAMQMLGELGAYKKRFGQFVVSGRVTKVLVKAMSNQALEEYEKTILVGAIVDSLRRTALLNDGQFPQLIKSRPFPISQLKAMMNEKVRKARADLNSSDFQNRLRDQVIRECHAVLKFHINTSPSQSKLDAFYQSIALAKQNALAVLPQYLSGQRLDAAAAAVRQVGFRPPTERQAAMISLKRNFIEVADEALNKKAKLSQNLSLLDRRSLLLHALMNLGSNSIINFYSNTADTCAAYNPPSFADAAYASTGDVILSWQSILWPDFGIGIVSHELGHIVSAAVSSETDLRVPRQCMIDNHNIFYGPRASSAGQTSEEDWADTFAISILKRLRMQKQPARNLFCILMPLDGSTMSFYEKSLELTEDAKDSHSTVIYRLLRVQRETVGLPPSCQAFAPTPQKSCAR